jgi:hypothetical protein
MYRSLRLAVPTGIAFFTLAAIPPMLPGSTALGLSDAAYAHVQKGKRAPRSANKRLSSGNVGFPITGCLQPHGHYPNITYVCLPSNTCPWTLTCLLSPPSP